MAYVVISKNTGRENTIELIAPGDTDQTFDDAYTIHKPANASALITTLNNLDPTWETKFQLHATKTS